MWPFQTLSVVIGGPVGQCLGNLMKYLWKDNFTNALHKGSLLISHPATLGLILDVTKNFFLMLLRFIDSMLRTMDRGLIIPIKTIRLVAN